MTRKERKLFNENRLTPIMILFCLAKDLNDALAQLESSPLMSDEEKKVLKPMLPKLFTIDKTVRDILASKRMNPLEFIELLNEYGYNITKIE